MATERQSLKSDQMTEDISEQATAESETKILITPLSVTEGRLLWLKHTGSQDAAAVTKVSYSYPVSFSQ